MEKRGRVLGVNEAHDILLTSSTRKLLVSWFDPFWDQMIEAVKKNKRTVILGGSTFEVKTCEDKKDYIFKHVGEFVPMIRISLDRLILYVSVKDAVHSS